MTLAAPVSVRVGLVQPTDVATAAAPSANALSQKWWIGYTRACPQIQAELVRKFWLPEGPARAAAGWMQGNGASEVP